MKFYKRYTEVIELIIDKLLRKKFIVVKNKRYSYRELKNASL